MYLSSLGFRSGNFVIRLEVPVLRAAGLDNHCGESCWGVFESSAPQND